MNSKTLRPYIECTLFVVAWVVCGWLFHLGPVSYNLYGIPFVVAFQLLICRRRITQLWVRDAPGFRLDRIGILLVVVFVGLNTSLFWQYLLPWHLLGALFLSLLITGSVGAAYALRQQRADQFKQALPSFAVAVLIGFSLFVYLAMTSSRSPALNAPKLLLLLENLVKLFPYVFIMDEVVFRGMLDTHVVPGTGTRREQWFSAVFISVLWALWHMPRAALSDAGELRTFAAPLVLVLPLGVALSFCWRKGGTLLLPGLAHALMDAYRDTVMH